MTRRYLNQKVSWIALSLLPITYAVQGYLLIQRYNSLSVLPIIVFGYILLQLIMLSSSVQQVRNTIKNWVISDAIHLISILVVAFLSFFLLNALEIFEDLLLVLAAEILARLDLQQKGLGRLQKLTILTTYLTLGLSIGWLIHRCLTIQST